MNKWHPKAVPYAASDPKSAFVMKPLLYRTFEDPLFPGTWRVEPVDYTGRGVVYLFHTEGEAQACVKRKNREYAELRRK